MIVERKISEMESPCSSKIERKESRINVVFDKALLDTFPPKRFGMGGPASAHTDLLLGQLLERLSFPVSWLWNLRWHSVKADIEW